MRAQSFQVSFQVSEGNFCLRPSAKDLGITPVVVVVVVVLVLFRLSHFLNKINLREKNISVVGNLTGVLWHPSQALYQLGYSNVVTIKWYVIFLT